MATVKRIGPGSAFKVGLALYGFMGLIFGVIFGLVSMLGGAIAPPGQAGVFRMFFGMGAIIALPLVYGIFGGIIAAITAAIYNFVVGIVGGLEVDID
ncbi:MAG TPA: hypothetical protein VN982_16040 [Candidatus Dormibacteraeota bacterium]|nr:hypothetical protein [Candidatus Dormibacteraeota bacterium]